VSGVEGRVGVITGGARGIGVGIAEAFLDAGARVAILDTDGVEEAAAGLGAGAIGLTADVTDEAAVAVAFASAHEQLGGLDFLINNAGIRHQVPFVDCPVDLWRRTIDVNLTGSFICAQAAVRLMLAGAGRGGAIVNLASIAGRLALRERAAYDASKGGVISLTQAIAAELAGSGIRCNAIAPGLIETPLSARYFRDEAMREIITTNTPSGHWGQAVDIAGPALFLCSDAASFVHGETLFVDGGWNAAKGY
jgi:NAD(P)-dependent dehydrogenase (short-subunit alcohol dehydrogenase family)